MRLLNRKIQEKTKIARNLGRQHVRHRSQDQLAEGQSLSTRGLYSTQISQENLFPRPILANNLRILQCLKC